MRKISRRNFLLASGAVTISAALSACGGSSSSTGAASSAAASSAASDAPAAQGKVLNIWCWNDEFQGRFNNYYPEVASIAEDKSTTTLKDGTVVKWTINANENNNYQNKLDEALLNQDSAADDDKVDIFLIEADYALKYVDSDYALDVKADIGLTDADLAGQYQYTKDIVSVDGSQRGTTWQATPGLFAYRRSIAKEVLGTDDPTEVQSHLSDWDKFNEVAAQAYAKGYKMLSGFDDAYRTFSNNVSAPWVTGTTVTVDENLMKWVDQTKEYTDKGYNNKSSLWDSQWAADQGPSGKVFGFFYSTWGINFTLLGNSLETPVAEGGKEEVGNGIYGDYAVCEGPQPYYWGGTWICAAAGTDNTDIIRDVMQKLTCDEAIMKQITLDTQDYTNNEKAMEEIANSDYASDFLGGQNHIALFAEAAKKIDMSNAGPYDQGLNESLQNAFKDYFTGTVDQDGLADTGTAEQTDLAALCVGADQVNDLDAGLQDLCGGLLLLIAGGRAVDGPVGLRGGGRLVVHRLTQQVEHAAQALVTHRHPDGLAGVHGICAAHQTIGAAHGNAACHIVAGQLSDLHHQLLAVVVDLNGVEQVRQLAILELDVQHRADDLDHLADVFFGHRLQLLF